MIRIRLCTAADRAAARALLAAQLEEHDLPTEPIDSALDGALANDGRAIVLLAEDATRRAVGVAWVSFTWTLEHGGKSAWLEELYVVPELRSQGIGGQLLEEVLRETKGRGCRAVDLEVESAHARAANLYARAGFVAHTRARWVRKLS
jgi:GNAT superfamily N-acetyltransferase